jgi:hypothetical protein
MIPQYLKTQDTSDDSFVLGAEGSGRLLVVTVDRGQISEVGGASVGGAGNGQTLANLGRSLGLSVSGPNLSKIP